jgi:hypothetical protein
MLHILALQQHLNLCIKTNICTSIKCVSHIIQIRMRWVYYISSNIHYKYENKEPYSTGNVNLFSDQCSYICHFEKLESLV